MKILWTYRVLVDGGTHITTWRETWRHMSEQHELRYILPYHSEPRAFAPDSMLIKKVKWPGLALLHYLWAGYKAFKQCYREWQPEVVILDQWTVWFSWLYRNKKHKPLTIIDFREANYRIHDHPLKYKLVKAFTRMMLKWHRRHHEGISYISEALREKLEEDFFALGRPYLIWPSGVDTDMFDPSIYPSTHSQGAFTLFFHGSITANRGLGEAIEAIALLKEQGKEVQFEIVGDGKYVHYLKERVQELTIVDQVHFRGRDAYENMPARIMQADLCMMTYPNHEYWEINVPIKLLEYMAMQKVTLCSRLKVFEAMTHDAACVRWVEENQPEQIAAAISAAMEDRERLIEDGKSGRPVVEAHFTWKAIARSIESYIMKLKKQEKQLI